MSRVVGQLRRVALLQEAERLTDEQLLESFLAGREDAAFEALVRRHGPMILGVCRRVLHDRHEADDAFQATFLVFLRKAATIGKRELLANWLYGVARRTALQARNANRKRRAKEREAMAQKQLTSADDAIQEMLPLLDQELSRLPDKYRVPIILCDLEGKTRKKAALELGLPESAFSMRLDRARAMLAKKLARHGTTLSGSAAVLAVSESMASASVPPSLVSSTVKIGALVVAGKTGAALAISAKVAALTEGVVKAMLLTKLKTLTVVLFMLGAVGIGAGTFPVSGFGDNQLEPQTQSGQKQNQVQAEQVDDPKKPSKEVAGEHSKVRELLKERVETLKKRSDILMTKFNRGNPSVDFVIPALQQSFHAEFDFCESDQERVAVCERALTVIKKLEKDTDERFKAGSDKVPLEAFLDVVQLRLEVEIAFERSKPKSTRGKDRR